MNNICAPHERTSSAHSSRRKFLKSLSALAMTQSFLTNLPTASGQSYAEKRFVYVGTYTGAIGNGGNSQGIYLYEMNLRTGELTLIGLAASAANPSCLALHPSHKYLFATNEINSFAGAHGNGGSISAYAIDRASGSLQLLNVVSSEGRGPAHISVDRAGRYVFAANYGDGSVVVLPISQDGKLGQAADTRKDSGSIGPHKATNAPPNSFAISGHDSPHAHMIQASPDNGHVLYTDLGQDRIYVCVFDQNTGKLTPNPDSAYTSLPPGDGPRHFAFHSNGQWLYSIQEEGSTLVFFHYDAKTGILTPQQTISTLPTNFCGTNFTSEVLISPDGRFLYAANRLHDTIAIFAIALTGRLTRIEEVSTLGDYPAAFSIDPSGGYLYVSNLRSDSITCFRINKKTGSLKFTGNYTGIGSPGSMLFLS